MIHFVCHDPDGNLTAWGQCQPECLALMALPGTTAIAGEGTDQTHFVEGGLLTPYTEAQAADKSQRPAFPCRWDNALMAWGDLRTLAEMKAAKSQEINEARLAANQTTFAHAGKLVACDVLSRGDIDATNGEINNTGAMPAAWPGGWKALDNSYLPIADVAAWRAFYSSMFAQGSVNFAHSQQLKAQLAAASTAEQIAAVTWENHA